MYRALAKKYGWTFSEIAGMTLYQQHVALAKTNENLTRGTVTFNTYDEYLEWKQRKSNG